MLGVPPSFPSIFFTNPRPDSTGRWRLSSTLLSTAMTTLSAASLSRRRFVPEGTNVSERVRYRLLGSWYPNVQTDLKDLDEFMNAQLPLAIRGRAPEPFITQAELSRVMRWKLMRGKYRPGLQAYVDSLTDAAVRAASKAAFQHATAARVAEALDALSKPLKGVGPATASAVLAAFDPSIPFMSDEALALLGRAKVAYSTAEGVALALLLGKIASALQKAEPRSSARRWTAQQVQQAVWAAAQIPLPAEGGVKANAIAGASRRLLASGGGLADAAREEAVASSGEQRPAPPSQADAGARGGAAGDNPGSGVISGGLAGKRRRSVHAV